MPRGVLEGLEIKISKNKYLDLFLLFDDFHYVVVVFYGTFMFSFFNFTILYQVCVWLQARLFQAMSSKNRNKARWKSLQLMKASFRDTPI